MDDLSLASLLISRICHDLAAPAGAVNNGLELLRDEMPEGGDLASMDLLEFSSSETLNRLLFFRLAFGAFGGLGEKVLVSDAKSAALKFFEGRKVQLDWPSQTPTEVSQPVLKLLLNMVLLVSESLPRGGNIRVEISSKFMKVSGVGSEASLQPERHEALMGEISEDRINAQVIQAFYAGKLAHRAGVSVEVEGDGVSFISLGAMINTP